MSRYVRADLHDDRKSGRDLQLSRTTGQERHNRKRAIILDEQSIFSRGSGHRGHFHRGPHSGNLP